MKVLFSGGQRQHQLGLRRAGAEAWLRGDVASTEANGRPSSAGTVKTIVGDRNDAGRCGRWPKRATMMWWPTLSASRRIRSRLDLAAFQGRVGQYIYISSASAYQKPPNYYVITESTPLYNPYWHYSRNKIACEDRLVRAYREKGFPIDDRAPHLHLWPHVDSRRA